MQNTNEMNYLDDLQKIKETITENRNKAMVVVNSAMIMTYYEIGTIINERKTWGSKYIQNLANETSALGYLIKLILGVFAGLVSILWVLQIVVYIVIKPNGKPLANLLNSPLVGLYESGVGFLSILISKFKECFIY